MRAPLLAVLLSLLVAAPAGAAPPPRGSYDCTIGANNILFGTLTIKAGKRYAHRGSRGTFTATGNRLRFRRGTLAGMRGKWTRSTTGVEIALRNPRDDFESIYCSKR